MPPSTDWTTLDNALMQALDLDGAEREAYLASLGAGLRADLAPLLRDALRDFPLIDWSERVIAPLVVDTGGDVAEGRRVGPYEIEALVGEGGMGRVYRARRADGAFEQTVALKVVRHSLALAGSDVAARLRRERGLLATLDHPGIARLIDGGETDDGVPFLVTEFVDGAPITAWADARGLATRDRVRLVADVARAVDHAHRRLVVHRDLKPSNVFVTERDGAARPVVLDFGIAKLLEGADDPTDAFPLTQTGMRLLTPAYAAPELYEPSATVTTAADVYGLGALLYEVLTGDRPHEATAAAGPPTTQPTRPSHVVFKGGGGPSRVHGLRGDLDTICLRALHPDPARRYASAASMADDLERYLGGHPIDARRDSLAYVAGRFVRRHRATVAAAAVALAALVAGLTVSLVSLADAEMEAARAEEAADLLGELLALGNVPAVEGRVPTARDLLDSALVRTERVESTPLRAYLFSVLARAFDANEDPLRADSLLGVMFASLEAIDVDPALRAEVTYRYALAKANVGQTGEGHALLRRAQREAAVGTALHVRTTNGLSWVARNESDPEQGLRYAQTALGLAEGLPPDDRHEARVAAYVEIGRSYAALLRVPEAIDAFEQAWALQRERYGARGLQSATVASHLGTLYQQEGRIEEAGRARFLVARAYRQALGPDHHWVPGALTELAEQRVLEGDLASAEVLFDSAAVSTERTWGTDRWFTPRRYVRLAEVRLALGRSDEAAAAARHAVAIYHAQGGPQGFNQGSAYLVLGQALLDQGRRRGARWALERALEGFAAEGDRVPVEHQPRVRQMTRLAQTLLARLAQDSPGT